MRFTVSDDKDRADLRAAFRTWLAEVLPDGWVPAIDSNDEGALRRARVDWDPRDWLGIIGKTGYGAPLWPEEFGGLGGEMWTQEVIREELTRHRLPLIGSNILGIGLIGPTIIAHGSPAQQNRYLKKIVSGEEIWCQLFSEPGAGSDLASVGTRAHRDGDGWRITGQKVWTSFAHVSAFGLCLTRTDPDVPKHAGLTYFIVPMNDSGVTVRPLRQITGSAEFNEVFLDGVWVPDDNRVGELGDGWNCARTTLASERATLGGLPSMDMSLLEGAGSSADPWMALSDQVSASSPGLQDRLTTAWIDQQLQEITVFRARTAALRKGAPGPEGAVIKLFNAEASQRRADLALTIAGLSGVAWREGDDVSQARAESFLRTKGNTIEGGTSEVLRTQIAERVLGLPREPSVDRDVAWAKVRRG